MDDKLQRGDPAPQLELLNQDGELRSLTQLLGRGVIVYFFPKAFTPGCTTEVCDFRDNRDVLAQVGYTVFGVSADPISVLRDFATAHEVNHDLLSDPDHQAARLWGAWGEKTVDGKQTVGPWRSTFVVAPDGRLESVEYNLDAATHVDALRAQVGVARR